MWYVIRLLKYPSSFDIHVRHAWIYCVRTCIVCGQHGIFLIVFTGQRDGIRLRVSTRIHSNLLELVLIKVIPLGVGTPNLTKLLALALILP